MKDIVAEQSKGIDKKSFRQSIMTLQDKMEEKPEHLTPDDFPTFHHFAPGVYVREFHMQIQDVVIGKIHRHDHIAMLIKGKALVVSEQGKLEIESPYIWNSKAGEKRAVYALDDCVFVTIHPTEETDLDKIEEEVIAPSYDALEDLI